MLKNNNELNTITQENEFICFYIHENNFDHSNFEFLKRKKGWTYESPKQYSLPNQNTPHLYTKISIDCSEMDENIKKAFLDSLLRFDEKVLDKTNNITYNQMFKQLFNVFANGKKDQTIEKLHGDLGEALFILECIKLGYKDKIKEAISYTDNALLDFSFKHNNGGVDHIEVKTTTFESRKIKISDKQMNNDNADVVVVLCDFYEKESNILDLYNEISKHFNIENTILEEKKLKYEKMNNEFIMSQTIKQDEIEFNFYNKDFLPKIRIENDNAVSKIIIELLVSNEFLLDSNFKTKMIEILSK